MSKEKIPFDAEALSAFLDGDQKQGAYLDPADRALAEELMDLAQAAQPDPLFSSRLQQELVERARERSAYSSISEWFRSMFMKRASFIFAGALSLVTILMFVWPMLADVWMKQPPVAEVVDAPQESVEQPTAQTGTETARPVEAVTLPFLPRLAQAQSEAELFAGIHWTLEAGLPGEPQEVMVYRQAVSQPLTAEMARQVAASMGVEGEVYQVRDEALGMTGTASYEVVQGNISVRVINNVDHFIYTNNRTYSSSSTTLSFDERVKIASAFLEDHGLLDFEYHVETAPTRPEMLRFVRTVNGYDLRDTMITSPWIAVGVDENGEVVRAEVNRLSLQEIGDYPLRSAQQAWNSVIEGKWDGRISYAFYTETGEEDQVKTWPRVLETGTQVDIYGFPQVLQPIEEGGELLVLLDNYPIRGDAAALTALAEQRATNRFLHVWGQLQADEHGGQYLALEDWEEAPLLPYMMPGTIKRQDGQTVFAAVDGHEFVLADVPADVPEDRLVFVSGIEEEGSVTWFQIQLLPNGCSFVMEAYNLSGTGMGQGSGGGSGDCEDMAIAQIRRGLDVQQRPTPSMPTPYQPGDKVENLTGRLTVYVLEWSDGRQEMQYYLGVEPTDDFEEYWSTELRGTRLEELSELNTLEVTVWGEFGQDSNGNYIQVERFEKTHPEEKMEAWLGVPEIATVEGRKVILLKTREGETYVLASSLRIPEERVQVAFPEGQEIIQEGILKPDETFGGYTVIYEMAATLASAAETDSLDDYELMSAEPQMIPQVDRSNTLDIQAQVEEVSLVYFAYDLHAPYNVEEDDPARFVQPLWSFRGALEDGSRFEILVQAVVDEYLQ